MAKSRPAIEERLDGLYREHPSDFVATRNALAKELADAGERDQAGRVKKLRRPSVAAWLVNRAMLDSPQRARAFADAIEELEQAQSRALSGEDEGAAGWRAAAVRERDAIASIVEAASAAAREDGHPASAGALQLADETLRAASADEQLRERVLRCRVEREQSAATLGTPTAATPPAKRGKGGSKRAAARRELGRLEKRVAEAGEREQRLGKRIEEADHALRALQARRAKVKDETAELRRRLKEARRRAGQSADR